MNDIRYKKRNQVTLIHGFDSYYVIGTRLEPKRASAIIEVSMLGAICWKLMEKNFSTGMMERLLLQKFELEKSWIEEQIRSFFHLLQEEGYVVPENK